MKKKLLIGATLLMTVVSVKRKIAKLQNQIDVLKSEPKNVEADLSEVRAEINDAPLIKTEHIKVDEEFIEKIISRSAFLRSL